MELNTNEAARTEAELRGGTVPDEAPSPIDTSAIRQADIIETRAIYIDTLDGMSYVATKVQLQRDALAEQYKTAYAKSPGESDKVFEEYYKFHDRYNVMAQRFSQYQAELAKLDES